MTLIAGAIAVITLYLLLQMFRSANPAVLARTIKFGGGVVALAVAAFTGLRGELAVAIPLGIFGAGLLGWTPLANAGFGNIGGLFGGGATRPAGQASRVRSQFLDMRLDHDSGQLAGQIVAGPHAGRDLQEFDLAGLLAMAPAFDAESVALLESYLDRRFPAWRQNAQGDAAGRQRRTAPSGKMTAEEAYQIVDDTVARIRQDAERSGTWGTTHVWVVSDHGHSPVRQHDDIAGLIRRLGFRTIAHPFVYSMRGEVAVMVSGNAMAHIYLDLPRRTRPWLGDLGGKWQPVRDALLARDSVDLMILPTALGRCEIHAKDRGFAVLEWKSGRIDYQPATGDPLRIGAQHDLDDDSAYSVTLSSDYPDALVQIARLSDSPRSGEIILSASRDWDFRAKYEPIPHSSSHGALHREHMLVPLLTNRPLARRPRRTVDVMPSALSALGIPIPSGLDGKSFL